ncbi:MAG: class I SAM-dependent methyltransferase, partial [Caldisericum sp.]
YVEVIGEVRDPLLVEIDEIKFLIPFEKGQKTGFFLDQRDNRRFLLRISKDKIILDGFSYIGGFSFYALKGGAQRAYLIDRSSLALDLALEIAKLNGWKERIIPVEGDVFHLLKHPFTQGDILILDPPAFIKTKKDKEKGLRKYEELYHLGLSYFQDKEGLLLLFSCSH